MITTITPSWSKKLHFDYPTCMILKKQIHQTMDGLGFSNRATSKRARSHHLANKSLSKTIQNSNTVNLRLNLLYLSTLLFYFVFESRSSFESNCHCGGVISLFMPSFGMSRLGTRPTRPMDRNCQGQVGKYTRHMSQLSPNRCCMAICYFVRGKSSARYRHWTP